MLTINDVDDFISKACDLVKATKNNTHWHTRCPICGDSQKKKSKKRFHMDWNNGSPVYNCFNCNASGNFYQFYAIINNIDEREAYRKFNSYDSESVRNRLNSKVKSIRDDERYKVEDHSYILSDCISDYQCAQGVQQKKFQEKLIDFKKKRKIEDIPIYAAYKGKYMGRFIIPIYYKDMMIYFQARRMRDDISVSKYINPDVKKDGVILHEDLFEDDKFIIVTEGLIDAYNIGNQGTTCLGKEISDSFIERLLNYSKKIILAYDNDEDGKKSRMKFIKNSKYSNIVKYFIFPKNYRKYKDINEFYSENDINNLYKFIVDNSYSKEKATILDRLYKR